MNAFSVSVLRLDSVMKDVFGQSNQEMIVQIMSSAEQCGGNGRIVERV
jgi:RNA-binding protein YlmH